MSHTQKPLRCAKRGVRGALRRARPSLSLACFFLAMMTSTASAEEVTHVFDANLSLTGSCKESSFDPVPDPGCPDTHAPKQLVQPSAVAVDDYGNRYVADTSGTFSGATGRVNVFNSGGEFITKVDVALPELKVNIAVDSQGTLYVATQDTELSKRLLRFEPTEYKPAAGEIAYGKPAVAIPNPILSNGEWGDNYIPIAVNRANDHLFVRPRINLPIAELSSAAEGNAFIRELDLQGIEENGRFVVSMAIDATRNRLYVTDLREAADTGVPPVIKAFSLDEPADPKQPRKLLFTIDGSTTPTDRFVSEVWALPVAVDEATGHLFVGDLNAPKKLVYEFDADGAPVSTLEGFQSTGAFLLQMAYDNSPTSPTQGYLFVPSHSGPGRSLAFKPIPLTGPPIVEGLSVGDVTTSDAILRGKVNPNGVDTSYRVEYTTQAAFDADGFEGASLAAEGTLKAASNAVPLSAPASGLAPGTDYRFRIHAESPEGEDEAEGSFATFNPPEVSTDCPNQALRSGPSAPLPDCRAYELVTPVNTNGRTPLGAENGNLTRQVSPAGDKVPFRVEGGALPGIGGTGSLLGDPYLATRTPSGWQTAYTGPTGSEATAAAPGTTSPDQGYSFYRAEVSGSAVIDGFTSYVRYPDGHAEILGQGSLGKIDPQAVGQLISAGGTHIVFMTGILPAPPVQLEPNAAPDGTKAVYDRTPDGVTHVVSLKPNGEPFDAGQGALYQGASADGEGIAFSITGTLYLRYRNEETFEIGTGVDFAGVAEGGHRIFYVEGGDHDGTGIYLGGGNLKAFDVEDGVIDFSDTGDVTPVTVASDGSAAYFTSPSVLGGENPEGKVAQSGARNLYRSVEGQIEFVATVTERDVVGAKGPNSNEVVDGLGLWVAASKEVAALGEVPARSTPDGQVFLFKSRAKLTDYDSEGHAEIYRYDADAGELDCISCNPTGAAATSDATLQSEEREGGAKLFKTIVWPENLRADGRRAFFESAEQLVASDRDGLNDVYEWEQQGVGDCTEPGGCLALISSGQSGRNEYLWAVSASGDDVFLLSSDLLTGGDVDETPSIYDARVGGGFPPPPTPPGECLGEACQPAAIGPDDPTPASSTFQGAGNVAEEVKSAHKKKHRKAKKKHGNAKKHRKQAKGKRRAGR